jgi:hypothetical protein
VLYFSDKSAEQGLKTGKSGSRRRQFYGLQGRVVSQGVAGHILLDDLLGFNLQANSAGYG